MKKKEPIDLNQLNDQIKLKKDVFRERQKSLTFGEKMKIAFSLAERDKAIRLAIPLKKVTKGNND